MRLSVPKFMAKFVTACALILTCLAACDPNTTATAPVPTKEAVGAKTKAGLLLTSGEMCAIPVTDSTGKTTVATLRFQQNAVFIRRTRAMTTTSQFPVEAETRGTWGLLGETLFITENGTTVKNPFETFSRESDTAPCVRFTKLENSPEYCACEI